jgi:O-antigen/teichoic acid export membrane protein
VTLDDAPADVLRTPAAGGRVIRGGVIRAAGYAVGITLGAATSVFLLRSLGVVEFGHYAAVAALLGIVSAVTDAGLTAVGARELALRAPGRERNDLLGVLLGLRIVLTATGVLLATLFAVVVGYDRVLVAGTAIAGVGILLVNTQATAMMPLSVELRVGAVTAIEVLRQAVTLVGVALLALAGASLLPYFLVQVAVGGAVLAVTPIVVGGVRTLVPALDRQLGLRLLREAAPLAIAIAMNVLYLRLLVILLSVSESESTTGLFATSFRVFEMLIGIPTLVLSVALPLLAIAGSEDPRRLTYAVQRLTEVALLLGLFLSLVTFALARPAIELLAGDEFLGAVPMLRLQVWALVPLFLGQVFGLALVALRRQRAVAIANAIALAVVLVLGLVLSPLYGGEGAAIAGVVTESILAVLLLLFLIRTASDAAPRLRFAWRPLIALGVGMVPLVWVGLDSWAGGAVSAVAFGIGAIVFGAVPREVVTALARRDPGGRLP